MKDLTNKARRKGNRHAPLASQIEGDSVAKRRVRTGKLAKQDEEGEGEDFSQEAYVSSQLSKKILNKAREQADEEKQIEIHDDEADEGGQSTSAQATKAAAQGKGKSTFRSFEELMAEDDTSDTFSEISETQSTFQDDMTVNEEDEKALAMFMNPQGPKRLLSDIIMEKIEQHEAALKQREQTKEARKEEQIKPEIIQVYYKVGEVLRYFTSGKLPKAFKILPSLRNWEQLLYLTRPDRWTAVVTRMATFLFSRGMSDKLVQRFYFILLLPKIREEIHATKKLNFHLYLALKKSLYRPAAFFRGVLLPLCESGDCTLREATIVGSVMKRVSIPAIHASVAIYKLCQLPYFGATQYFIMVLLNKKFSLPYKVIDAVYDYFMNFLEDDRKFPAMWHQTLLVFVQRYKNDLTSDQKAGLQRLTHEKKHTVISQEINRELFSAKNRGEAPSVATTTTTTSSSSSNVVKKDEEEEMDDGDDDAEMDL